MGQWRIKSPFLLELIIATCTFVFCFVFLPITHDDYGSFILNMGAGQFSDFSFIDLHYMGLIGFNHVYKWLYHVLPQYGHLGIFFMLFQYAGLVVLLHSIRVSFSGHSSILVVRLVQILFSVFYIENILLLSHTKFSLLFCGLGLFNLLFRKGSGKWQRLFYILLFAVGLLHRPESGLGMVLLVSVGFLLYRFGIREWAKGAFVPVLLTVGLFGYFTIDRLNTDLFINQVEPEIEYKLMDRRYVDISEMKTAVDSVKYKAAVTGMWFDFRTLTPDYIRTLLLPGIDLSAKHAGDIFAHILSFYRYFPFCVYIVLAFGLFFIFRRQYLSAFRSLAFFLFTFMVLYCLDFNGRLVDNRHFLNIQIISLLIQTFYWADGLAKQNSPKLGRWAVLVGIGAAVPLYLTLSYGIRKAGDVARITECHERAMADAEKKYRDRLIVTTMSNVYLLNHNYSLRENLYKENTYIMYDMFTYSLIPEYLAYLSKKCGCDAADPVAFFGWLHEQDALYLAERDRYELTSDYMRLVHGVKVDFVSQDVLSRPSCIQESEYFDYEMRRVVVTK